MKTKSSNSSASLGKRKDTDSIFRGSKLTISRSMYKRLLRLGVIALATGSPLLISGCDPKSEIKIANSLHYSNDSVAKPNTYGIATDSITTGQTTVAKHLADMFTQLGIPVVKLASSIQVSDVIKNGDVIQFGYHDNFYNTDLKLAINEELSTKDTLVFDGISNDLSPFGGINYIRYKVAPTADGVLMKQMCTKFGEPPSENSGWNTYATLKYIPAVDGVKEYAILPDGTIDYRCKIVPKNETTISREYVPGNIDPNDDWSKVSLFKLNNIDTGLHDVHM
ncbi:MAG: hypothetical protein WCK78_07455 [Paludibacter sp.]